MSYKQILSTPGLKPVLFTLFMAAFGFGVILPLLPFYTLSLGAQPVELGMLTATFATMSLVFAPLFGKLADRIGRKQVLMIGTAGFVVSYLLFAAADSLPMLFLARGLEGLFASGIFPACVSLLSDYTTNEQRGKAMGLVGMSFSMGLIFGPAFGGLASAFSVRDAFLLAAALAAINFFSVWKQVREPREKPSSRTEISQEVSLLSHITSPLLFLFLSTLVIAFMIGGLDATLAIYTGVKLGFSSPQIGLIFTYIGTLILVTQLAAGNLISRFGELKLIPAGFVFSGIGFFLLIFAHDWLTLLFALTFFVFGNAMVFPSVNSMITKKVQTKRGAVLGLVNSFQSLGQIIGPLVGGLLYSVNHDYPFGFMALVVWAYAAIFLFFGIKRVALHNA